ncbi:MAG: hypothetical protein JSW02_10370 [candidate division WOR-3 bacterium]|nr:MAG: hypothetical protein JSW02_10370 [candidate division WOR-3 bacterium]
MRRLPYVLLFMLWLAARLLVAELIIDIPLDTLTFAIGKFDTYDRIDIPSHTFSIPGHPELPVITYTVLLEYGQKIERVRVIDERWRLLDGTYDLYPAQLHNPQTTLPVFTHKDHAVYGADASYPASTLIGSTSGNVRGYQIGQVIFCPFRYRPKDRKLSVLTHITLCIETIPSRDFVQPIRQSRKVSETVKRIVQTVAKKDAALTAVARGTEMSYEDGQATDLPSLLGAPVDMLIITTESLQAASIVYARTRTVRGFNCVVKTMPWVRQHYTGADDAERLRNFLKDAVEKWGVLYVLLIGEIPDIPVRWIQMTPIYDIWPVHIVTDLYFSDLDGTWNEDEDFLFGEVEDSLDLFPDVFVGRLPVNDSADLHHYLDKLLDYERPADTTVQTRALFFTSDFETSGDALDMAIRFSDRLPAHFETSIINERPLAEVVDSLEAGFGLVAGLGHGDINNIRVRNNPRENANNFVFDSLMHGGDYACMFVITCYTNTFQSNSLSKHWISNPQGGGIAYIGPTGFSEAWLHEDYTNVLLDSLFDCPLSVAVGKSKIPFIADAQWDNWYRFYQFAINQLGDPTVSIWGETPQHIGSVNTSPVSVQVGTDTLSITCDPPVNAPCIFYKDNETFILDTILGGMIQQEVKTQTSGFLVYSIIPEGYVAFTDSVPVQPVDPYLVAGTISIIDSAGNNNGTLDPDEDILLTVSLHNTGALIADHVRMQLFCDDTLLEMLIDTASYPNVMPGDSGRNSTPFSLHISKLMPDQHSFVFECVIDYHTTTSHDSFQLTGQACDLKYFTHEYTVQGNSSAVTPILLNHGYAGADSVSCIISSLDDSLTVTDSIVRFASIPPFTVKNSYPDTFGLERNFPGAAMKFLLQIYDDNIEIATNTIILDQPPAPDSIWTRGTDNGVVIEWLPVDGAAGYHVFRATALMEPYELAYTGLVQNAYLEDKTVEAGHHYYYYVRSVDSCLNHSSASDTVIGSVNPPYAAGWPQVVYDYLFSSPNFGDLDAAYPGYEIVVCGKEGNVYAWHADGSPVVGDGRIFSTSPAEVWSSPALGDVNADGGLDIVFGVRRTTDNLYILDNQGECLAGWPLSVPGSILSSPVLADIDDDDDLEVFVWTLYADLYAFHHDGTGVYSPDGLLKTMSGIAFGTPAIGDINADGALDICCAGGSGGDSLYVWDHDGNALSRFPIYLQPRNLRYSVVLGNVLGDDRLEITLYADSTELVYLVSPDGDVIWTAYLPQLADVEGSPIIADISGDGKGEIVCAYNNGFTVLDSLGQPCPGFPDLTHNAKMPIAADVDSSGGIDLISGSTDWHLYAYTKTGVQAPGFPIRTGSRIESCPAVFDIDNDGMLELMVGGNDYQFNVFDLRSTDFAWPRFRFDPYNTGTYNSPFLPGTQVMDDQVRPEHFRLRVQPSIARGAAFIWLDNVPAVVQNDDTERFDIVLSIYDVSGRRVKTIACDGRQKNKPVVWFGDDDLGRRAAAGIYFVQVKQDRSTTCKLVLLH